MKFLSAFLLVSVASAFAPPTPISAPRSSSAMQMVADDAKVCLVTGSSRGLGKSIALDLGKAGQKVVINYVSDGSKESADATVEEIKALGGDAIAVQADSKYFKCSVLFPLTFDTGIDSKKRTQYYCNIKAPILFKSRPCSTPSLRNTERAMCSSTMLGSPKMVWLLV